MLNGTDGPTNIVFRNMALYREGCLTKEARQPYNHHIKEDCVDSQAAAVSHQAEFLLLKP